MKKLLLLIVTIVLFESVQAQIPQTLNYQGIARNANGEPIRYQEISVRISIIDSALAGKMAYQETRRVRTNYVGLFNIVIGSPDAFYVLGSIGAVDWATGNKHIRLEIDPAGQSNYTIAGTTKLQSVPYALYSTPSGSASGDLTGNYPAPTIASKAVTNSKLADGSVTDIKVAMGINPAKVGLEKVNNTADIDKPISNETQKALDTKLNIADTVVMLNSRFNRDTVSISNRINLKANISDVTTSLATKVDKVVGKELSTNDYTTAEKIKLAAITGTNTGDQDLSSFATNTALALKANTSDVNVALALKENLSNKSVDLATDGTSDVKYPSVKSVKNYVDQMAGNILSGQVNADWTATAGPAKILNKPTLFNGSYSDLTGKPALFSGSYSDLTNKPALFSGAYSDLTGKPTLFSGSYSDLTNKPTLFSGAYADLTGPIPIWNQNTTGNAATATKLAAPKNINGVAFDGSADITISTAASTLSGTVLVANGGTGTSTITGIVKGNGTNAMTAAVAGTDYLEPTGSAANLTNFPTFNQNTTGNAATATKLAAPKNINGVAFDGSADITIAAAASTLSGTVQVVNGGTGLTTAGLTGQVLTTVAGGTLSWTTPTSISVGTISTTSNVNGASITAGVLNLAPADDTNGGVVTTGTQTFAGSKTFSDNILVNSIRIGAPASGSANTMIGAYSLLYGSPGSNNTAVGTMSLASLTNTGNEGNDNTAVGTNAIRQGGAANGSRNTAVGSAALSNGSGTYNNTAVGYNTLAAGISGASNTAVGTFALQNNTTANYNVGIGYETLKNTTTGGSNTAIGKGAMLSNISGDVNTAIGESALISNTNGRYNTSIGVQSQEQNTSGQSNTAIGVAAIDRNGTGSNNAVLGAFAGRYIADNATSNTVINNSVLLGFNARPLANNANNEIVIGYNAIGNGSNTVTLGNSSITSVKTSGAFNAPVYSSTPQALTAGSNISWNPMSGLNASVTLNANSTLAFSELPPVGSSGTLIITQPTSGGTFSLTLPTATTNRVLGSSSGITLSSTNSAKDILSFYYDGNAFYWNLGNGYGSTQTVNATNIVGGAAGAVLYQSGAGVTGFTAAGTTGQVLTSAGTGAPTWTTPNNTSVGSISGSSTANGASITSGVLNLAPADASNGGVVTTGSQTFAGAKTFSNDINVNGAATANAAVTSEVTSSFTIDANNAETYKGKIIICNPSAAITITFAASLPTGFNCMVLQKSVDANKVTFAAGSSVTIKNRNNYTATAGNYALATIVHIGGNIIVTAGDMQ